MYFLNNMVSQNTNDYINHLGRNKLIYISSLDGLNIFNSLGTVNNISSSTKMYGTNIQSQFYEDSLNRIWYTTYEALHVFDPSKEQIRYFFMVSNEGDSLKDNYKAFQLDGNKLWLKAGNKLFQYHVWDARVVNRWNIDLTDQYEMQIIRNTESEYLFTGGFRGYALYTLGTGGNYQLVDKGNISITALLWQDSLFWMGGSTGKLYRYDFNNKEISDSFGISTSAIKGILPWKHNQLLLSHFSSYFTLFDLMNQAISGTMEVEAADGCIQPTALMRPYMDSDSTLFVGSNGQGVFFCNINKRKFDHFLSGIDVTKILPLDPDNHIVLTRKKGILSINNKGQIIKQWKTLPGGKDGFSTRTGVWLQAGKLLFTSNYQLYLLDLSKGIIFPMKTKGIKGPINFIQADRLTNGKVVVSLETGNLYELNLIQNTVEFRAYFSANHGETKMLYFKQDAGGNLYVSNDEVSVFVYAPEDVTKSHRYLRTLPLTGGVLSISDRPIAKELFFCNSNGLYAINKKDWTTRKIMDRDKWLVQTIYGSLLDEKDQLWLSTNKGLIRYDPASNTAHAFSRMDGIQESEYNANAFMQSDDGSMYFGGVNGLNYFHPDNVHLSERPAPVYFSGVKINDEPDSLYHVPQYVETYDLSFGRNTISFNFHAIDYSDPEATRVKYRLKGMDRDYVESEEARGFARYANLPPGQYTFSVIGRNADGIWNAQPREIVIRIHPPFWRTKWFIGLSVFTFIGGIFLINRNYYRSKMIRILEKQKAIDTERTRIASEMHDDLGSGLTTIRYLSDKALRQAKDQEEVAQIKRIAEHSNALVRNMSEIIWAMNSRFDTAESLISYLRRYASEYLEEHHLPLRFEVQESGIQNPTITGEKRRNIFLVLKEVLHNTVKYAGANRVNITIRVKENLEIRVSEIGSIGFDPELSLEKGNGLYNCRKRMASIQGDIRFEKTSESMDILFTAPLT